MVCGLSLGATIFSRSVARIYTTCIHSRTGVRLFILLYEFFLFFFLFATTGKNQFYSVKTRPAKSSFKYNGGKNRSRSARRTDDLFLLSVYFNFSALTFCPQTVHAVEMSISPLQLAERAGRGTGDSIYPPRTWRKKKTFGVNESFARTAAAATPAETGRYSGFFLYFFLFFLINQNTPLVFIILYGSRHN